MSTVDPAHTELFDFKLPADSEALPREKIPMPVRGGGRGARPCARCRDHAHESIGPRTGSPHSVLRAVRLVEAIGPGVTSVDVGQEVVGFTPRSRWRFGGLRGRPRWRPRFEAERGGRRAQRSAPDACTHRWAGATGTRPTAGGSARPDPVRGRGRSHRGADRVAPLRGARHRTASAASADFARSAGADERLDPDAIDGSLEPVDISTLSEASSRSGPRWFFGPVGRS